MVDTHEQDQTKSLLSENKLSVRTGHRMEAAEPTEPELEECKYSMQN